MTPEFLRAVVDTLLPGEQGDAPGTVTLPSGSAAGVDLANYAAAARPALDAIARAAGGAAAFATASEVVRAAALRSVERELPDAFKALVTPVLADYYESAAVLIAFGWRPEPPQPQGHALRPTDEATHQWLDRVRRRAKLWRD
jgi:hypothetical protein